MAGKMMTNQQNFNRGWVEVTSDAEDAKIIAYRTRGTSLLEIVRQEMSKRVWKARNKIFKLKSREIFRFLFSLLHAIVSLTTFNNNIKCDRRIFFSLINCLQIIKSISQMVFWPRGEKRPPPGGCRTEKIHSEWLRDVNISWWALRARDICLNLYVFIGKVLGIPCQARDDSSTFKRRTEKRKNIAVHPIKQSSNHAVAWKNQIYWSNNCHEPRIIYKLPHF